MRFVLFGNTYQTKKSSHIEKLLGVLRRLQNEIYMDRSFYEFVKQELGLPFEPDGVFEDGQFTADLAISMGGDGTFLKAASRIGSKNIPIVGMSNGLSTVENMRANTYTIESPLIFFIVRFFYKTSYFLAKPGNGYRQAFAVFCHRAAGYFISFLLENFAQL